MSRNWNLVFYNEGEASFIAMNILCIRIENKDGYIDAYEVVELHDRFMASLSNKERKVYKAEVSRRAKLQDKTTRTIKFDEQLKSTARDTSLLDDGFEFDSEDLPSIDDEYYRD